MSLITKNQITIVNLFDGVKGDPGVSGTAGGSLYTWTVYAKDTAGTGISLNPNSETAYVGLSYNHAVLEPDLSNPEVYTWIPYFAYLIASKIKVAVDGALYSGYAEDGTPPASGRGFYLGNGMVKAHNGEFTGTFRSGVGANENARLSAKETVGVAEVTHAGGTQNDLQLVNEGDQKGSFVIEIDQVNIQHTRPVEHVYAVGDIGPSGGYIFYDKGNWGDGWRYLETAPNSWLDDGNVYNLNAFINNVAAFEGSPSTALTGGIQNGEDIIEAFTSAAPYQSVKSLSIGGYANWYIPSKEELDYLLQRVGASLTLPSLYGFFVSSYQNTLVSNYPNQGDYTTVPTVRMAEIEGGAASYSWVPWQSGGTPYVNQGGYLLPIHKVTTMTYDDELYYQDRFRWQVDSGAWQASQEIVAGSTYSLGYGGLEIAFGSPDGHTLGESWAFDQDNLFGISIKDSNGTEYLKASNGVLEVSQVNSQGTATTHKVWGAVAN